MEKKHLQYITLSLVSTGSIVLSYYIYSLFITPNKITLYWTMLTCLLSFLSTYRGGAKSEFIETLIIRMMVNIIIACIITLISSLLPWAFQLSIIFSVFLFYNLQDKFTRFNNYAAFIIIYALFAHYIVRISHLPTTAMIHSAIQGILIGSSSLAILAIILPFKAIEKVSSSYTEYSLKRSVRVTLAFTILALINFYIPLYKYMWAGIAIVVVMQGSLGLSIQKAGRRLTGTILGICLGVILINLLPDTNTWHLICALGLLLIGGYFIASSYTGALTAYTALLAMVFSLLHPPHITLSNYLFNRLLDTAIGIVIAVCCEIVIFPRSFVAQYRKQLGECYLQFQQELTDLSENYLQQKTEDISDDKTTILINLTEQVKYEPLIMLSRRRRIYQQITARVRLIDKLINKLYLQHKKNNITDSNQDKQSWDMLANTFASLIILRKLSADKKLAQLQKIQKYLKESCETKDNKESNIILSKETLRIQHSTRKLIASYTKLLQ